MKKPLATLAALTIAFAATLTPAFARTSYVIDDAHLLSPAAVSSIDAKVADLYATAHKEVVVVIEPVITTAPQLAAERVFAMQQVNGVLIFIAKSPKTIGIVPDNASEAWFSGATTSAIRQAIASAFNSGDYDGGVSNGVDLILAQYRSHLGALRHAAPVSMAAPATVQSQTGGGFNMSVIWWLIALAVIFFIVRGVFRAMSGPRMMPPGYGGGPMGPGGPMGGGYGPGYGGGYGYGGGGGGFWSGMLGGLGGAFLGNELFGGNRTEIIEQNPGMNAGVGGDYGGGYQGDAGGFQSDPGQADMGNSSFGGWGGGDSGGGGWGDMGGGGGDSGGGGGW